LSLELRDDSLQEVANQVVVVVTRLFLGVIIEEGKQNRATEIEE
jgi:hypothetical protein